MKQQFNHIVATGLATVIWIVFSVSLLIGFDGVLNWVTITLLFLFVYASIMLWKTVFDRRVAPLELMFWLFHTNFFLLPALSQSYYGTFFWGSYASYKEGALLYACVLIIVGILSFKIGGSLGHVGLRTESSVRNKAQLFTAPLEQSWLSSLFLVAILGGLVILISILGVEFFT
ncbi:MAG: hypothetical protein O7C75_14150, partial [Verrucomicrobia bacterium]|nr:hypothetical protein [Verrucomicrobiota bacterium]